MLLFTVGTVQSPSEFARSLILVIPRMPVEKYSTTYLMERFSRIRIDVRRRLWLLFDCYTRLTAVNQ